MNTVEIPRSTILNSCSLGLGPLCSKRAVGAIEGPSRCQGCSVFCEIMHSHAKILGKNMFPHLELWYFTRWHHFSSDKYSWVCSFLRHINPLTSIRSLLIYTCVNEVRIQPMVFTNVGQSKHYSQTRDNPSEEGKKIIFMQIYLIIRNKS